jgi:hypothetical protein
MHSHGTVFKRIKIPVPDMGADPENNTASGILAD